MVIPWASKTFSSGSKRVYIVTLFSFFFPLLIFHSVKKPGFSRIKLTVFPSSPGSPNTALLNISLVVTYSFTPVAVPFGISSEVFFFCLCVPDYVIVINSFKVNSPKKRLARSRRAAFTWAFSSSLPVRTISSSSRV